MKYKAFFRFFVIADKRIDLSLFRNRNKREIKMEKIIEYSPIIIVILMFFIQQRIFVTPEQLEKKHREIIEEIEEKFVTIHSFKDLKDQFSEVKEKIDKMYDLLIDLK